MVRNVLVNHLPLKNCLRRDSSDPVYEQYFVRTSLQLHDVDFFLSSHLTGGTMRLSRTHWLSSGPASWQVADAERDPRALGSVVSLSCGFCLGWGCGEGFPGGGNSPGKGTEM